MSLLNLQSVQWRRQDVARRGLCPVCKPLCPGHAPAGKPSSFHSVVQQQFFTFHCTIFHTNRGQLFGTHGTGRQDFESKFQKKRLQSYGRGLPHSAPQCCWDPDHRALLEVMMPHPLVPQQEQTPGAATESVRLST